MVLNSSTILVSIRENGILDINMYLDSIDLNDEWNDYCKVDLKLHGILSYAHAAFRIIDNCVIWHDVDDSSKPFRKCDDSQARLCVYSRSACALCSPPMTELVQLNNGK